MYEGKKTKKNDYQIVKKNGTSSSTRLTNLYIDTKVFEEDKKKKTMKKQMNIAQAKSRQKNDAIKKQNQKKEKEKVQKKQKPKHNENIENNEQKQTPQVLLPVPLQQVKKSIKAESSLNSLQLKNMCEQDQEQFYQKQSLQGETEFLPIPQYTDDNSQPESLDQRTLPQPIAPQPKTQEELAIEGLGLNQEVFILDAQEIMEKQYFVL